MFRSRGRPAGLRRVLQTERIDRMKFKHIHISPRAAGIIVLLVGIASAAFLAAVLFIPNSIPESDGVEVVLKRGVPLKRFAAQLKEQSVIADETAFLLAVKLTGASQKLQAGRYRFEGRMSNVAVIRRIRRGITVYTTVTLPEGSTARRMAGILSRGLGADSTAFMARVRDPEFCKVLGIVASTLEGYLYPDTYRFNDGESPETVLRRVVSHFNEMFSDSLRMRSEFLGFTVHQIVTIASIIEGEALLDAERPVISAVYHNRLRNGMALQACPTIQYLLPDGPRHLLNRDLTIDSPYNTYLHPGLPPGPVNNPGRKAILAALYPAPVGYLYMVANGDGSHTFSTNLVDHNAAKKRFNQIRKKVRSRQG